MKLTAAAVERIKPLLTGRVEYFDATVPALGLRVSARGVKSWIYFGRVAGKQRRVTLGRWPSMTLADARKAAGGAAEAMREGHDLTAEKRAAAAQQAKPDRDLVENVIADWLERDQAKNRSAAESARIMNKEVLPFWRGRHIWEITRRDAIEIIDRVVDRGSPTMARRLHAYLHRLFRWARGRGIVEANPMADLPKPGKETKRTRVLDDNELRVVWKAAEAIGWPFGPLVRLLVLTGARRGEIGEARWREVDIDGAAIRLEGGRTKNGEPHTIPLSMPALAIIGALPRIASGEDAASDYVFTVTGKSPVSGWGRAKAILDAKVDALRIEAAGGSAETVAPMPGWRFHDIRRTVATGLQRLGHRLEVIEAVLGHIGGSRSGIVGVYQRYGFDDEARAALEAWGAHVAQLTGGTPARVIPLRR